MTCNKCGYEIKEGNKFCTNCGQTIDNIINNENNINKQPNNMKIKLNKLILIIVLGAIIVAVLGVICANLKSNKSLIDNKQDATNNSDKNISLYEYIQQNSVYSSQYLNKMNSTKSESSSLNVVDTETMTFKIGIESFYDYFLRYVFQNRVEGPNTSKVDLAKEKFPLKQIDSQTWTIEDTVDKLYTITIETSNDKVKKIDVQINDDEKEYEIMKEIGDGFRMIVSNSSSYNLWSLNTILNDYDYYMDIPIGVQNMIIEKQTNKDKTHIIIKTGFEEEYIELLKSKEQPREEDFFGN